MKKLFGVLLILAGLALGVYVGLIVMFIGGIREIIDGLQVEPDADGGMIAWGIVRVVFASLIGVVTFLVFLIPGVALATGNTRRRRASSLRSVGTRPFR